MRSPLPSFAGVATWLNGEIDPASLEGHPVFVHFWSFSCHMCHETAEAVAAWRDRFAPLGLVVIAVHQPRSQEELDVKNVAADAKDAMHITQPCAVDNEHVLVDRFENQFVPAFYLFNAKHELRHFQAGDKGLERITSAIERVLEPSQGK
ncbi:MAG TPA: redoxin domain-containing protein [Candidatus Baltobacteraceae bacterium]|jgi:thiol-disulfide isomerase/thioredoxin|nr:redoxin domain-containing protein [Candidatus Baltobacteraceae bacterium]